MTIAALARALTAAPAEVVHAWQVDAGAVTSTRAVEPEGVQWSADLGTLGADPAHVDGPPRVLGLVDGVPVVARGGAVAALTGAEPVLIRADAPGPIVGRELVEADGDGLRLTDVLDGTTRRTALDPPATVQWAAETGVSGVLLGVLGDGDTAQLAGFTLDGEVRWRRPLGILGGYSGEVVTYADHDEAPWQVLDVRTGTALVTVDARGPAAGHVQVVAHGTSVIVAAEQPSSGARSMRTAVTVHDLVRDRVWRLGSGAGDARGPSVLHEILAVGVREDAVVLHHHDRGYLSVDRDSGDVTWGRYDLRSCCAGFPQRTHGGDVLWWHDDDPALIDASTLDVRPLGRTVLPTPRPPTIVDDHLVWEQGHFGADTPHGGVLVAPLHEPASVRMFELPALPPEPHVPDPSLVGQVLVGQDGTIAHAWEERTRLLDPTDGSRVGRQLNGRAVALTPSGVVTIDGLGRVRLFDDGKVVWTHELLEQSPDHPRNDGEFVVRVVGDRLLAGHSSIDTLVFTPDRDDEPQVVLETRATVRLLDLRTGEVLDEAVGREERANVWAYPDGRVVLSPWEGGDPTLVQVAGDADRLTATPLSGPPPHPDDLFVAGEHLVAVTRESIRRVAPDDLSPIGDPVPFEEPLTNEPVVLGGLVIGVSADELTALDVDTGRVAWRRTLPAFASSLPSAAGDRVYVGLQDGSLYSVEVTGDNEHVVRTGWGPIVNPPVVAHGAVLVMADRGRTLVRLGEPLLPTVDI